MAGKQKSVRWEPWVEKSIQVLASTNGKTFSWMANYLMEVTLNDLGLRRKDFEPDFVLQIPAYVRKTVEDELSLDEVEVVNQAKSKKAAGQ